MNDSRGQRSRAAESSSPEGPQLQGVARKGPRYGILERCIGYNLRISYALASQLFARVFEDQELAPIQFAALEFIAHNPHLSQRQIAAHIGTAPTVLVKPLDKLEKRGLISRLRSADDRRRARVRITPAGEGLLREARQRILSVEEQLTEKLTREERRTLLDLLRKIAAGPD